MLKYTFSLIRIFCISLCIFSFISAQTTPEDAEQDYILALSSYNPDTHRLVDFLSELEKRLFENNQYQKLLIKDLEYGTLNESESWKERMQKVLKEHNKKTLKGILILGQEAWSVFLSQDTLQTKVPFYACFVSDNVLELPDSAITSDWAPKMFEGKKKADLLGKGGGYFTHYDIPANIRLIRQFYPSTTNIAFLSDNSYGGIAMQTLVKQELLREYPDINLILLDSRTQQVSEIKERINNLPPNTAILIGTWRIDCNGSYFSKHTLKNLIPTNCPTPVFTISGLGLGSVAIGGYIPDYQVDATSIADDLSNYYNSDSDSTTVFRNRNQYSFDKSMLEKNGIREFQLPPNSIILDPLESKLKKYQEYIFLTLITLFILVIMMIRLLFTERKLRQKQKELIRALGKAEKSEKLKSAFLANMSHEIRTPLNAIVGFSELLLYTDDQNDKERFGELIQHNNELLLTLINDLLDLSKIEAGYIEFSPEEINLNDFTMHLYSTYNIRVNPQVELIYESPDKTLNIQTDPKKLNQILTNYLSNAMKFTSAGSIRFGWKAENGSIYFYVKDTGIGIAPEDHPKVFDRFQKIDSFAQGTGLGLSIAKAIAEAAGGQVGFHSEKDKGSCFWCRIPYETTENINT